MTAPIIFIDTETTGLAADNLPWEFAGIRREPDGFERTFHCFIDTFIDDAEQKGLEIGGFYKRHPQGVWLTGVGTDEPMTTDLGDRYRNERAMAASVFTDEMDPPYLSQMDAARYIARATHGAHIVGANPAFDQGVLARFLRANLVIPAWHYHLIDVYALALGYLRGRGEDVAVPWSGRDLRERLGVPVPAPEVVHTALGDAVWARDMYDAVMGA